MNQIVCLMAYQLIVVRKSPEMHYIQDIVVPGMADKYAA